mgnify:CR=1 FL=1
MTPDWQHYDHEGSAREDYALYVGGVAGGLPIAQISQVDPEKPIKEGKNARLEYRFGIGVPFSPGGTWTFDQAKGRAEAHFRAFCKAYLSDGQ